jgi:hypothetical protein
MLDAHLDPDTLAAEALSKPDAQRLYAHLAGCRNCRDCLRLHSGLTDFPSVRPARQRAPYFLWKTAAATALAALCLFTVTSTKFERTPHSAITTRQLRTFTLPLEPNRLTRPFKLPGPLAAARLGNDVSFLPFPAKAPPHTHQIALQTSLGERWIALDFSPR